jgi:hypothetical protein
MNNIASDCAFSEPDQAREYYAKVLAVAQPALGEHHALSLGLTLAAASLLKLIWVRTGASEALTEARVIEENVLAAAQHKLGHDHPLTITATKLLASTF